MSSGELTSNAGASWELLRAGGYAGGGLEIPTVPTDVATVSGPVRLAVGTNGEPRLLLPLTRDERPASMDTGNALSVSVSQLSYKGARLRFLDLICVREELEAVFGEVVDEILTRIGNGDTCADAAQSTIADFRALLMRGQATGVSTGRVAGLVAELLVLERLLDRSPSAWRAWRGPVGDRHDFRVGNTSLEVKASLRSTTSSVTINGLGQLDEPTGGTLHLLRFVLEPVTGGMLSLANVARSAMSKADEPLQIETLLNAAGCAYSDDSDHLFRRTDHRFQRIPITLVKRRSTAVLEGRVQGGGV